MYLLHGVCIDPMMQSKSSSPPNKIVKTAVTDGVCIHNRATSRRLNSMTGNNCFPSKEEATRRNTFRISR